MSSRTAFARTLFRFAVLLALASSQHDPTSADGAAAEPAGPPTVRTTLSIDSNGLLVAATALAHGPVLSRHHPSHVLVKFRPGTTRFLPGSRSWRALGVHPDLYVVDTPAGLSVEDALREYRNDPDVLYAEPDYVVHTTATPNDPAFTAGQQWDMTQIAAPAAWDTHTDAGDVVAAVVDTGIDLTHPDLQANLYTGDGGLHGYTCINGPCVAGGQDDYGHGTHLAGTIGATTNNSLGMAAINWRVQLLSMKFLGASGSGLISDAVNAYGQILALKASGVNIRVTNNSWGSSGYSQALKDAMTAVEDQGIVNVCAAGNSAVDTDRAPFYPADFDNRGLISVLATGPGDIGANFTNYGLASVDIAAPGVNTYSTVPTGACALCDPSGYALLSGTSMATPHVTGVVAALLHGNPTLTASLARDAILDPVSYDGVSDLTGAASSTGGRLNFAKAITNTAFLSNPRLDTFPVMTLSPDVIAQAGDPMTLWMTATDADNDPLRYGRQGQGTSLFGLESTLGIFGWGMWQAFPTGGAPVMTARAPVLGRDATVAYSAQVTDMRGGAASGSSNVTVVPSSLAAAPPTGTLTLSSNHVNVGDTVTVNFPVISAVPTAWASNGVIGLTAPSFSFTASNPGVFRIGAQAVDSQLNLSTRQTTVLTVGDATGQPPLAGPAFDRLAGLGPLTVNIDLSGSTGSVVWYFFMCDPVSGEFFTATASSTGSCTFTTPGPHLIRLMVLDTANNADILETIAMVLAPTPPTVVFTTPGAGSTITGTINVTGTASDDHRTDNSAVANVQFAVDGGAWQGVSAGISGGVWSWSSPLDTSTLADGLHTLSARATDALGTTSTTTISVGVRVPMIAITSPAPAAKVFGTISMTGTASAVGSVSKVEVSTDGGAYTLATGTTTWSYSIDTSALTAGNHTFTARMTDNLGATAASSITLNDVNSDVPPTVTITFPTKNTNVPKGTTAMAVFGTAADTDGTVSRIEWSLDSGVYQLLTVNSTSWSTGIAMATVAKGAHTITVRATDDSGKTGSSAVSFRKSW